MKYNGRIIDFHTHIQPAAVILDRTPYVGTEPDFSLLYSDPATKLSGPEDNLVMMDKYGISSSVILGFAWRNEHTLQLHNDAIIEAVKKYPGRFHGLCCVYPFSAYTASEAVRCLAAGAAGIGEIGLYDRDLDREYIEAMAPVMKVCRDFDRPVMMHVNEPVGHIYDGKAPMSIKGIYEFVREYPDNRIVLAHWGGGLFFFNSLKKEVGDVLKNVWYDSAASPYLFKPSVWKLAAETVGIEKILFGTDFPLLTAKRFFEELETCGFSNEELEMILFRNALKLLTAQ